MKYNLSMGPIYFSIYPILEDIENTQKNREKAIDELIIDVLIYQSL